MTATSTLAELRARIRAMEQRRPGPAPTLPLFPCLADVLPDGGLPLARLHQVVAEDQGAATAFAALIAGRLARLTGNPVLWLPAKGDLYPPGLAAWGLEPAALVIAAAANDTERLWAMEESLRCPDLACVVGEIAHLDLTAGRRLQLAAEAGQVTALALHPSNTRSANAGTSRWRMGSISQGRWRVILERCRNGRSGEWEVDGRASSS